MKWVSAFSDKSPWQKFQTKSAFREFLSFITIIHFTFVSFCLRNTTHCTILYDEYSSSSNNHCSGNGKGNTKNSKKKWERNLRGLPFSSLKTQTKHMPQTCSTTHKPISNVYVRGCVCVCEFHERRVHLSL